MADIITPDGPVANSQGGTVYIKRYGDFSRFIWGGECVYVGDISNELGGLNITTRANAREGGLRRDGVLIDPPGNVSTTLSMKRLRGDRLKTALSKCFWIFDKRTQCNNFDDPTYWNEIERVYQAKVGTRTTTPGTAIRDANAEAMVNFDVTALEGVDIYRVHLESALVSVAVPHIFKSVSACHGERCVNCGNDETDAVLVAGTELVGGASPHIYVNEDGGNPGSWSTDITVSEWLAGDVDGIVCLGSWGAAVSITEAEVLYTRDRFVTRVAYTDAVLTAHPPAAIDASSQSFVVFAGADGYIYLSRDGLATYEVSNAGTVSVLALDGVAIAPSNNQVVYVWSGADDEILKTENAGETWYQVALTGTAGGIFSLAVHPDNANLVLCGTDNGELFQSTDGGETWTEQGDLPGMTAKANVNIVDIKPGGGGVWFLAAVEAAVSSRVYINYEDGGDGVWEYYNPIDSEEYSVPVATPFVALAALSPNACVVVGGGAAADVGALIA